MPSVGTVCSRCVLDESAPEISFNADGVCNYCIRYDNAMSVVKRKFTASGLRQQIDKIKKEGVGKDYDAIVGVSGGVDSTYVLYQAVKVHGLRVLALHVDAGWNSEIAVRNIHRAVEKLGVDLHTHVIDWSVMKDVQASFFKASVVNCDIPQDHCFKAIQYKTAKQFGIRHFVSGRNTATDYMMPTSWVWSNDDGYHIKKIHSKFGKLGLGGFPLFSAWYSTVFVPYFGSYQDLKILNYTDYKRLEAKQTVSRELGWSDYGGKHYESVFTEFYQGYYLPEKFGFDKRKAHLSGLVNNGEITRESAMSELESPPLSEERISELKTFVLKKLGFSEVEWQQVMNKKEVPHTSFPNRVVFIEWLKGYLRNIRSSIQRL